MCSIHSTSIAQSEGADCFMDEDSLLREWPPTDRITVLMEAVLANDVKAVARMLQDPGIIWNQRGPCGRKPEQVALDRGYYEVNSMLIGIREKAELESALFTGKKRESKRL